MFQLTYSPAKINIQTWPEYYRFKLKTWATTPSENDVEVGSNQNYSDKLSVEGCFGVCISRILVVVFNETRI